MKHTECYQKDYPRPQLVRKDWLNLNGEWDFAFDEENRGESLGYAKGFRATQKIRVPYAYQSPLSGINIQKRCDNVWYQRTFTPQGKSGERFLLNFEGCDHVTKVWLNGVFLGTHTGGYARFTLSGDGAVQFGKENLLVVKAEDSYSCRYPRGKQRCMGNNHGCWYIDTTGIYKTVWAETVGIAYIQRVDMITDYENTTVRFEMTVSGAKAGQQVRTQVRYGGAIVAESTVRVQNERVSVLLSLDENNHFFMDALWAAHASHLYDVTIELLNCDKTLDTVGSYFGMVKYRAEKNAINVNDASAYLKMLLDQGYWSESHLTPPDEAALLKDIELTLEAGFNGIRKHQKIEDERFYYYCDILGVYVWCEMPSMYEFSTESAEAFTREWVEILAQMRNHPCIMAWVPFNESWGVPRIHGDKRQQQFTEAMYHLTKSIDSNRLVISNDGWDHTVSDLATLHNYSEFGETIEKIYGDLEGELAGKTTNPPVYRHPFAEGYAYSGQPVLVSEYGGIAYQKDGEKGWGYGGLVADEQQFLDRLRSVTLAIKKLKGVCGYCLTQTTDVQQEVNGVLTEDRKWKADVKKIREINQL